MAEQITIPCPQCSAPVVVRGGAGQLLRCASCRKVFPAPPTAAGTSMPPTPSPHPRAGRVPPPTFRSAPPPMQAPYSPPVYKSPAPGVTKGAFWCGLLFFIAPVALVAVILGIIGVIRTSGTRGRGRGFAITGLVLGVVGLALFAAVAPVAIARGKEGANRVKCGSNLRQIGMAMLMYSNENRGAYPPTLNELLLTQDISSDVCVCPSTSDKAPPSPYANPNPSRRQFDLTPGKHLSYVYLGKGMTNTAGALTVLVYEPLADHREGSNVLFGDGRVEFIPKPVMDKVLAELQAGQNPPQSLREAPAGR
jgi:prepilin-type processing-associated H-X9-DG protein